MWGWGLEVGSGLITLGAKRYADTKPLYKRAVTNHVRGSTSVKFRNPRPGDRHKPTNGRGGASTNERFWS
eukprot:scaffold177270_cov30-Tisochrysis_lutea.AAC.1